MLSHQLPPESRYAAILQGGIRFHGWTVDRDIHAGIYNLLRTIAAGLGGQQLAPTDFITRPQPEVKEQAVTIADFDVAGFMRTINS